MIEVSIVLVEIFFIWVFGCSCRWWCYIGISMVCIWLGVIVEEVLSYV